MADTGYGGGDEALADTVYGGGDGISSQKWDRRFLALAEHVSGWSRDPSTKVGAVITRPDHRIVSLGFNGFPKGVEDAPERYADRALKYRMVVHGEINAIHFAERDLSGCILHTWPFMPCARCAGQIIQTGIVRVVAPVTPERLKERWDEENAIATAMFREAGVAVTLYTTEDMERWLTAIP